jgi:hypothetical protein
LHVYYESEDLGNDLYPGTYAGLAVIGDDDGSHLVLIVCGQVVADLRVPTGVMWDIWNAVGNAATDTGRASEYDSDNWQAEVTAGRQVGPLPEPVMAGARLSDRPAVPPPPGPVARPPLPSGHAVHHEYGMTLYGRHEIPGVVVPASRPDDPRNTRPLPAQISPGPAGQSLCQGGSRILRRTG